MDIKRVSQCLDGTCEWVIKAKDGTTIDFDTAVSHEAHVLEISAMDAGTLRIDTDVELTKYITLSEGAFNDLMRVVKEGGAYEITKSTDGEPMILAKTAQGYTRQFMYKEERR